MPGANRRWHELARRPAPGAARGGQRWLRSFAWVRAAVLAAGLAPLARLVALGHADALGANPVEFVTRSTGIWTLALLCATLAVTPLRRLSGWHWLVRLRRMLGLLAFLYAALHFGAWLWFEHWFDVRAMVADVARRPFVALGFAAFALLLPLAATSTDAAIRRLGRRWRQLHRLVYAAVVLAVLHYALHKAGKNDFAEPLAWALVVAVLLGARVVAAAAASRRAAAARGSARQAPLERE